jgi:flagellar M-ring protein FliF
MSVIALPKPTAAGLRDLGRLQDIPALRQLGLLAMVAAAIALGLWLFFWTQRPDYVPVQAGLDAKSSSEAAELLRGAQIPFRIDPASGALAVPEDQLAQARMALAVAGLPSAGAAGFETMQGDQGFGTSQFVETARYQHALEIELARTIAQLRPVREARVHLALPKPSAFTRQRQSAAASVVLHLRSGSALEQGQVNAIVHLVASGIPDLAPEQVTVVDQFGRLLSDPDPAGDDAAGARQFEQQRRQEAAYVQRIQELLEPMAGPGRVSAQVSVDMDFAQTEEARERYGPTPAMVRSEQISESGNLAAAAAPQEAQGAKGVPGSASNTPQAPAAANAPANATATNASANPGAANPAAPAAPAPGGPSARTAVRNYELDRTLTHTRQSPGRIRRVTAAVLVDNLPQAADGRKATTRALTEAELKRVETLVQQAIGFDGQRGDMVSVVNAPFARESLDAPAEDLPLWQHPKALPLLRTMLGGIAVLVLILTVLRPAFRQMLGPKTAAQPAVARAAVTTLDDVPMPMAVPAQEQALPAASFEQRLEQARGAAGSDPKRVAQVMRDWVGNDG